MDILRDSMTSMVDRSTNQDVVSERTMSLALGGESLGHRSDELPNMEGPDQAPRKRQRRFSGQTPTFQCRICQRTYERADRLTRHLKTHENARRYVCQRCQKSFNRADLLARHLTSHNRNDAVSGPGYVGIQRTGRAGQACIACATGKARCEDEKPCRRCQTKNIVCEVPIQTSYVARRQWSTSRESQSVSRGSESPDRARTALQPPMSAANQLQQEQENEQQQLQLQLQQQHLIDGGPLREQQQSSTLIIDGTHHSNPQASQLPSHNSATGHEVPYPESVEPLLPPLNIYDMQSMRMDGSQLVFDTMSELLFMPNGADFSNQNLDLNFHDFAFEDELLDLFPAPPMKINENEAETIEVAGRAPRPPTHDVRAGYAAFTRSPWLWTPTQRDRVLRHGEDLTLDEGSITSALSPRYSGLTPNVPSCGFPTIRPAMRDKMYYVVSTMTNYTNRIPTFPSLGVLNHVVQAFFVRQAYQVDNWIHVPSMAMSDIIPELSLGLVIAGSTVISVPAIWKMGLVLQDVVRIKVGELWERENSATRKIQPLQAWMLLLDAGLWSGFQRQMELAESFVQPMITMMRRGGMFGATAETQALIPLESDVGQVLEVKWTKWTQRESFKRLSIHLFLHDTRASIALQKYPLISVTEITIALPAARHFFLAGSALEWKSCFLNQRVPLRQPSLQLIDIMQDISLLENLESEIDISLCCTAAIHGFWCQIWTFRESWKFHAIGESKDSAHRLWLVTQQRELYQQVETFQQNLLNMQVPQPELLITAELLLMILHVSPEELQRFAGKYGEEAASQAHTSLERWSSTEQARRAVWHAGQVFRWAEIMPPAELRDFYAIAVYFASLTLWSFGHLSNYRDHSNGPKSRNSRPSLDSDGNYGFVVINSEKLSSAHSFISGRQIAPVLRPVTSKLQFMGGETDDGIPVRLNDPNAVLQLAQDLYRSNFPMEGELQPPLVENMGKLMRALGSMAESRFSRCVSPMERATSGATSGNESMNLPPLNHNFE